MAYPSFSSESEKLFKLFNFYIEYDKTRTHKTKMIIHTYGDNGVYEDAEINKASYDRYFNDKNNLAAIVIRDGEIIYERYNKDRQITPDTTLNGMSMAKSATASVIGTLLCQGRIHSLDDTARVYSHFLAKTPYAEVKINNILQMMSGISPAGRTGERRLIATVLGLGPFSGKGSVRNGINLYKTAATDQGKRFNYHQTDPLALSLISHSITNESLSHTFYKEVYSRFSKSGRLHWSADNNNVTSSFSSLIMRPRDWARFGQYIMQQINNKTCLGNFFSKGIESSVSTTFPDRSYGFLHWVQDIDGELVITFRGKGGQLIIINPIKRLVVYIASISNKYSFGNINDDIGQLF